MKKRILSLLLSLIMILSLLPTTAWAAPGGGPGGGSSGTTTTVDHIDISINFTIPGTSTAMQITKEDAANIKITDASGTNYPFTVGSYNSGASGVRQIRLDGSFPVGTVTNPTNYTLTLDKSVNGTNYTLQITTNYWSPDNDCPPLKGHETAWQNGSVIGGSGIDTAFGTASATEKQVNVTKTVSGVDTADLAADKTFTITFSQNGTVKKTVDLKMGQGVASKTVITTLPVGTYDVVETSYDSYADYTFKSTTYSPQTLTVDANGGSITVTNTYEKKVTTGNLTIEKTNVGATPNSVTFTVTGTNYNNTVTLPTDDGEWTTTLNNLPLGTYTVTESDAGITGYDLTTTYGGDANTSGQVTLAASGSASRTCRPGNTGGGSTGGDEQTSTPTATVNVTNTYTQKTKNIAVEKVWNNTDGNFTAPKADSVTVTLYENDTATSKTLTLSESNNWKGTFENLPTHKNGQEITYTVVEGAVSGYTGAVTDSAANGYTITNTPVWSTGETKATLTVVKVDSKDNTKKLAGATFTLYNADKTAVVGAAQTTTSTGTITFEGLTAGTYTLVETTPPAGYTAAADKTITIDVDKTEVREVKDTNDVVTGYEKHTIYKNASVTVDNTMNVGDDVTVPAKVTITKVDSKDRTKKLTGAVFTLTSTNGIMLTSTELGNGVYEIANINEAGDWTLSETVAPTGYDGGYTNTIKVDSDGGKFALDTNQNKYYTTTTYTIDGKDNYTLTAPNARSTTSVTVTKDWNHGDVPTDMRPTSVTVKLLADGEDTGKTVTLSATNRWTDAFTGLNTHDDSGKKIDYTVEEVTVLGYDGDVTGTADNGYKITNTAKWSNEVDITGAALTIKKVDSTDDTKLLSGAKFQLSCSDLNYSVEATTDANGIASFTDLQPGIYTLEEVSAPNGYKENNQVWTVEVTQNETHTSVNKLADGTFQKVYDCTVTVSKLVNDEYAPMTPNNDDSYTITNELAPTEYKATVEIEKIVKKTGGNVAPGKEEFVFVAYYKGAKKNMPVGEARIITNGVETYTGTPTLTVPASAFKLDANGDGTVTLYVSEVKGSSAGWTYDAKVYELVMTVKNYEFAGIRNGDEIEFVPSIDSVPEGQLPSGDSATVTLQFINEFSQTNTPNRPHKPSKPITSVKTGDAGVAMYAMSGLLSLGGAALFMKKRKDEE